jgi:hypothetical protein
VEGGVVTGRPKRIALLALAVACGAPAPATESTPALPPARVTRDSSSSVLVPPNYGTLKQDEISIVVQPGAVRVSLLPLDETVIRLLAPDSYHTLRSILEGRRQQIAQRAQMHGVREPRVWFIKFQGLEPDARFIPTDVSITSGGRDYRPFDVIPLTGGFGDQRLRARETQQGLLLFDEGVDDAQSLVVTIGSERNADWSDDAGGILPKLDRERANVRARAAAHP